MMSYLRYGLVFLVIAPALVQSSCNFTKIESTKADKTFNIKIYDGGVITKSAFNKPPNTTELPEVFQMEQTVKPGVVFGMKLLYPDGLNYTFNMYTTEDDFYVSYSFFQQYNGQLKKTECPNQQLPYKNKGVKSVTYFKYGTSHSKTSNMLKFEITEKKPESSSAVPQHAISYLTAFIAASIVLLVNLNKV